MWLLVGIMRLKEISAWFRSAPFATLVRTDFTSGWNLLSKYSSGKISTFYATPQASSKILQNNAQKIDYDSSSLYACSNAYVRKKIILGAGEKELFCQLGKVDIWKFHQIFLSCLYQKQYQWFLIISAKHIFFNRTNYSRYLFWNLTKMIVLMKLLSKFQIISENPLSINCFNNFSFVNFKAQYFTKSS